MIGHGTRSTYTNHGCRCDPCRAAEAAYKKAHYIRNKAKVNANCRAYRAANRDSVSASKRRWREANKQHIAEWGVEYRKENAEAVRARKHVDNGVRRARLAGNGGAYFTAEQLAARMEYFGNRCAIEGAGCNGKFEHVDHIKPVSKGGGSFLCNLRPACAHCNLSKHAAW